MFQLLSMLGRPWTTKDKIFFYGKNAVNKHPGNVVQRFTSSV